MRTKKGVRESQETLIIKLAIIKNEHSCLPAKASKPIREQHERKVRKAIARSISSVKVAYSDKMSLDTSTEVPVVLKKTDAKVCGLQAESDVSD